jgi:chemotaxis protein MotB
MPRESLLHSEDEESYFVSMTDMVIGLLFVFIIMLMFFAMRFQQASTEKEVVTQKQETLIGDLTDAEATRTSILEDLKALLKKEGIDVIIVKDEGILRLPEELLFGPSSWEVRNRAPVKALGDALNQILPCYTSVADLVERPSDCKKTKARIEAIFIEGHADLTQFRSTTTQFRDRTTNPPPLADQRSTNNQSFSGNSQTAPPEAIARRQYLLKDNLDLSALRATSTFRELLKSHPELERYRSPENTPVLSVSGYGSYRPIPREAGETEQGYKQRLRRIDLRILMATPRSEVAKQLQEQLERTDKP